MSENPHDIPYSYLYYFSVIAAEGNLTRAAERLYKTQPSLSVAMKKLEAALGFSLFEHHGNRLVLNEAGKCLLEYVNSGLILFEDGVREARKIADSRDVVRIATSMGIVRNIAAEYESRSGMRVEVITCDTEEVLSRVFSGKADIGVNFGFIQDSRVTSRTLMLGPYRVAINRARDLTTGFWRKHTAALEDYMDSLEFAEPEDGALMRAVLELPEKYRAPIHLFYFEDYSIEEIAALLGRRPGTVKSQLSRARALLKTALKEDWNDDES